MIRKIKASPPEVFSGIKLKIRKKTAGGLDSIINMVKYTLRELDPGRAISTLSKVNQMDGYDCPGCAWPDPDDDRSSLGEFCENGAKAVAEEATVKRAGPDFFEKYSVQELSEKPDYWLGKTGRLIHPMRLREGENHYKPISWNEAFEEIARHLNELNNPNEAVFYTSGRTSNEAAFMYQLFVREFGTNNMPDCSNMCHESSGVALSETVGIGKGSVKLEDFYQTDLIIISGQNPGTNHPRMLTALKKAKENGARIITINPIPEAGLLHFKHPQDITDITGKGVKLTDHYLQVRINQDVPLLKAINRMLVQRDNDKGGTVLDHDFIASSTSGFEKYVRDLKSLDLEECIEQTGLSRGQVEKTVEMIENSERIIFCWAMGLTQHKNAVDNIQEIVNLLLMKGSIGKPGAGTCPVRGHSNVQGDRTMGIWESPKPAFLDKLQEVFGFDPPREPGLNTVQAIKAMHEGRVKVFFAMGGNFLSATPDTEYTAEALQRCELTVQVSTKLNRSHLVTGKNAIILPCLGRTERDFRRSGRQFVSVENSTGIVHQSIGGLEPASDELKSEIAIVAELGQATLGSGSKVDWQGMADNYDNIRDKIEEVVAGFENYNERVRHPGGFYLPNAARDRSFNKLTGKAKFSITKKPDYTLKDHEFLMMTIRSHDQFNTTIYGMNDRFRGVLNERRVVFINKEDMEKLGIERLQPVNLKSNYGKERSVSNFLAVPYDIPTQCIATYFPEANPLVPAGEYARKSETPISKSVIVTIEQIEQV